MIFNVPQYDLISPLLEVINKTTTGPEEVNKLGNMAIQLLEVNPLNGRFRFKHVIVKMEEFTLFFLHKNIIVKRLPDSLYAFIIHRVATANSVLRLPLE